MSLITKHCKHTHKNKQKNRRTETETSKSNQISKISWFAGLEPTAQDFVYEIDPCQQPAKSIKTSNKTVQNKYQQCFQYKKRKTCTSNAYSKTEFMPFSQFKQKPPKKKRKTN